MLFPDWANAQEIMLDKRSTYKVTQDSFLIGLYSAPSDISMGDVLINGKRVFSDTSGRGTINNCPCFYCTKGTALKNDSRTYVAVFHVIPLVKSGGE